MVLKKKLSYVKLVVSIITSLFFLSYLTSTNSLERWNIIDSLDLIFHEAGHTLFIFFGQFLHILSGSFFQVFFPLVFVIYFSLFRKEFFSASFLLFWVGQSIINVSIYMGDAVKQQLPLLGGDGSIHDWNYILSTLNLLKYTDVLANLTLATGKLVILAAVFFCFLFSFYKFSDENEKNKDQYFP